MLDARHSVWETWVHTVTRIRPEASRIRLELPKDLRLFKLLSNSFAEGIMAIASVWAHVRHAEQYSDVVMV